VPLLIAQGCDEGVEGLISHQLSHFVRGGASISPARRSHHGHVPASYAAGGVRLVSGQVQALERGGRSGGVAIAVSAKEGDSHVVRPPRSGDASVAAADQLTAQGGGARNP
jgi:hypothetical protein